MGTKKNGFKTTADNKKLNSRQQGTEYYSSGSDVIMSLSTHDSFSILIFHKFKLPYTIQEWAP